MDPRYLVERARPIGPSDRILDLACGSEAVAGLLRDRLGASASVTGLDWRAGSAAPLPFTDGSFELVLCLEAPPLAADGLPALREVHRVLSAGGRLIAGRWAGETARPLLIESGFTEIRLEPDGVVCARRA